MSARFKNPFGKRLEEAEAGGVVGAFDCLARYDGLIVTAK